ncbi:hypothetical protein Tco_1004366 [Tanacetum coccineum]|uniref:Uncharacterized protein n=1 Tax=Tanacetum coccineum TaxID=301880 RepID=A0ABQ5FD15_9ASTR
MLEDKKRIGLSWEPQVSSLLFGTKSVPNDKSKNVSESSLVYKPNSELIDGLFVPPNDPKKVNKILKKHVKDTAGKSTAETEKYQRSKTKNHNVVKDRAKQSKLLRNVMDPETLQERQQAEIMKKYEDAGADD